MRLVLTFIPRRHVSGVVMLHVCKTKASLEPGAEVKHCVALLFSRCLSSSMVITAAILLQRKSAMDEKAMNLYASCITQLVSSVFFTSCFVLVGGVVTLVIYVQTV